MTNPFRIDIVKQINEDDVFTEADIRCSSFSSIDPPSPIYRSHNQQEHHENADTDRSTSDMNYKTHDSEASITEWPHEQAVHWQNHCMKGNSQECCSHS